MLDLNRKPQKTEDERRFDELNKKYEEMFGASYAFYIGISGSSWSETLEDIQRCIDTGTPQSKPEYDQNFIY